MIGFCKVFFGAAPEWLMLVCLCTCLHTSPGRKSAVPLPCVWKRRRCSGKFRKLPQPSCSCFAKFLQHIHNTTRISHTLHHARAHTKRRRTQASTHARIPINIVHTTQPLNIRLPSLPSHARARTHTYTHQWESEIKEAACLWPVDLVDLAQRQSGSALPV